MKRLLSVLAFVLLGLILSGCAQLLPTQYTHVAPHAEPQAAPEELDALTADSQGSLKRAIRSLVQNGVEHGVIRVREYDGDVEQGLAEAAYQVAREDPLGLYAVDYMTHDCSLIVSFYEIHIDITFRKFATPLDEIPYVSTDAEAIRLLHEAMDRYDEHLTMYLTYDSQLDYAALAETYFANNPRRLMARPALRQTRYPETGSPRIVELTFSYPAGKAQLREMEQAVSDTLSAASVYVRYRESELEKARLLFSYLTERFTYAEEESDTPVYSLLFEGLATSQSMAQVWQMLCDETGLECYTVTGLRDGAACQWNIVLLDGEYMHLDILRDMLETGVLTPRYDEDLTQYYFDAASYPACPAPEPVGEFEPGTPDGETPEEDPGQNPGELTPGEDAPEPAPEPEPEPEPPVPGGEPDTDQPDIP